MQKERKSEDLNPKSTSLEIRNKQLEARNRQLECRVRELETKNCELQIQLQRRNYHPEGEDSHFGVSDDIYIKRLAVIL